MDSTLSSMNVKLIALQNKYKTFVHQCMQHIGDSTWQRAERRKTTEDFRLIAQVHSQNQAWVLARLDALEKYLFGLCEDRQTLPQVFAELREMSSQNTLGQVYRVIEELELERQDLLSRLDNTEKALAKIRKDKLRLKETVNTLQRKDRTKKESLSKAYQELGKTKLQVQHMNNEMTTSARKATPPKGFLKLVRVMISESQKLKTNAAFNRVRTQLTHAFEKLEYEPYTIKNNLTSFYTFIEDKLNCLSENSWKLNEKINKLEKSIEKILRKLLEMLVSTNKDLHKRDIKEDLEFTLAKTQEISNIQTKELLDTIDSLQAEKTELSERFNCALEEKLTLKSQIQALSLKVQELETSEFRTQGKLEEELELLKMSIEEKRIEIEELHNEKNIIQLSYESLLGKFNSLHSKKNSLTDLPNEVETESSKDLIFHNTSRNFNDFFMEKEEIAALRQYNDELKLNIEKKEAIISALQDKTFELNMQIDALSSGNEKLLKKNLDSQDVVKALEEKSNSLTNEVDKFKEMIKNMSKLCPVDQRTGFSEHDSSSTNELETKIDRNSTKKQMNKKLINLLKEQITGLQDLLQVAQAVDLQQFRVSIFTCLNQIALQIQEVEDKVSVILNSFRYSADEIPGIYEKKIKNLER